MKLFAYKISLLFCRQNFCIKENSYEFSFIQKPSGQDRIAAEWNYVAKATHRKRKILLCRIFIKKIKKRGKMMQKVCSLVLE